MGDFVSDAPRSDDLGLDVYQQIYAQVLISSAIVPFVGTQSSLQGLADHVMPFGMKSVPNWTLRWGPTVWKLNPEDALTGADSAYFASEAKDVEFPDGTFDCCLVAFAGSSTFSQVNWLQEDLGVTRVDDFEKWLGTWATSGMSLPDPGNGTDERMYIAEGTGMGVFYNMTKRDPHSEMSLVEFLVDYVRGLESPGKTRIILAGYSLGGTIATTLSLGLSKARLRLFGDHRIPEIITVPFACPSPGNGPFAKAFNATLPMSDPNGFRTHNAVYYNTNDIVPQAFSITRRDRCLDNIVNKIYTLDNTNFLLWPLIKAGVELEKTNAKKPGTAYVPVQGVPFTTDTSYCTFVGDLVLSIVLQHTLSYSEQLGLDGFYKDVYDRARDYVLQPAMSLRMLVEGDGDKPDKEGGRGLARKTLEMVMKDYPVLRYMQPPEDVRPDQEYPYDTILGRDGPGKIKVPKGRNGEYGDGDGDDGECRERY